jgi:hypothetical protein
MRRVRERDWLPYTNPDMFPNSYDRHAYAAFAGTLFSLSLGYEGTKGLDIRIAVWCSDGAFDML